MFDRFFFLALKFSAGSYLGDLSSNIPHPWSAVSEHNFDSGGRTVKRRYSVEAMEVEK